MTIRGYLGSVAVPASLSVLIPKNGDDCSNAISLQPVIVPYDVFVANKQARLDFRKGNVDFDRYFPFSLHDDQGLGSCRIKERKRDDESRHLIFE